MSNRHFLFLVASTRGPGHMGNTEWLARQAAASLPADTTQTWVHLARAGIPEFVDQRHTVGSYPMPEPGSVMRQLLDQTLACTDLVLVAPVYWFSFPSTLKAYLDHWSAWLRVPGLWSRRWPVAQALTVASLRLSGSILRIPQHSP